MTELNAAQEALNSIMLWHARPDMGCVFFNGAWLAFTGRRLADEVGEGWLGGIHPKDRDRVTASFEKACERREEYSVLYRLRRVDGRYRQMIDHGNPSYLPGKIFDGYFGYCVDLEHALEARDKEQVETAELERRIRNLMAVLRS